MKYISKSAVFVVCLLCSTTGCSLMEKALIGIFAANPELTRQKEETKRQGKAHEGVKEAKTPEQTQAHVEIYKEGARESHPSFWSNMVSGLYTEEGRRMAGLTVAFLGSLGVAIWKITAAYTKGQWVLGLGKVVEGMKQNGKDAELVKRLGREKLGKRNIALTSELKKHGVT